MQTNFITVRRQVAHLICEKKGVKLTRLAPKSDLSKLGFDELDLVEVILEVEKKYGVIIPDEVPLRTIDDFVHFLCDPALKQAS